MARNKSRCLVNDCCGTFWAKGYCRKHYSRYLKYGDPTHGRAYKGQGLEWLYENKSHNGEECLEWPFGRNGSGYGAVNFEGSLIAASRAMCIIAHGRANFEPNQAAHICHNPICVNPSHLKWETPKENVGNGRRENGTIMQGEMCNLSKLTEQDVRDIREIGSKDSRKNIAAKFGISPDNVGLILRRKSWAHL